MDDRELLELAAKAAGEEYIDDMTAAFRCNPKRWNPLTDDGDALRLMVKLHLDVTLRECAVYAGTIRSGFVEIIFDGSSTFSEESATRRAIVRAAAEIGKKQNEMR